LITFPWTYFSSLLCHEHSCHINDKEEQIILWIKEITQKYLEYYWLTGDIAPR
jgi:hypothetical protein